MAVAAAATAASAAAVSRHCCGSQAGSSQGMSIDQPHAPSSLSPLYFGSIFQPSPSSISLFWYDFPTEPLIPEIPSHLYISSLENGESKEHHDFPSCLLNRGLPDLACHNTPMTPITWSPSFHDHKMRSRGRRGNISAASCAEKRASPAGQRHSTTPGPTSCSTTKAPAPTAGAASLRPSQSPAGSYLPTFPRGGLPMR